LINTTKTQVTLRGGGSELELLVNDLSIDGQFPDIATFKEAIERIMQMRKVARRFGCELQCHRNVAYARVTQRLTLQQAINSFSRDQRQALMQWLTRHGPFWEDARVHSPDDYLECNGDVVTDTAVGEAAICRFHGNDRHLASLIPSRWEYSPLRITWVPNSGPSRDLEVTNYWNSNELELALRTAPAPVLSWEQLARIARTRCQRLEFSTDCFQPLLGIPFVVGASRQVLTLLDTLDRFMGCFDEHGQRTPEGQRLYQDHFTGDKAWFSDSSDAEKIQFKQDLTFRHPTTSDAFLFCPWKGKVKTPQLRIHFSWPVSAHQPLYVVYVGPKITKH
jgi:hypothetical protein